jgi:hypothetical protein
MWQAFVIELAGRIEPWQALKVIGQLRDAGTLSTRFCKAQPPFSPRPLLPRGSVWVTGEPGSIKLTREDFGLDEQAPRVKRG